MCIRDRLHAVDLDAPGVGRFVEDTADFRIDRIAGGERMIELHLADDITPVSYTHLDVYKRQHYTPPPLYHNSLHQAIPHTDFSMAAC